MSADAPEPRRPWFGPKRFGFGIGPQTWQGWMVLVVAAAVIVVVVHALGG